MDLANHIPCQWLPGNRFPVGLTASD